MEATHKGGKVKGPVDNHAIIAYWGNRPLDGAGLAGLLVDDCFLPLFDPPGLLGWLHGRPVAAVCSDQDLSGLLAGFRQAHAARVIGLLGLE